MAPPRISPAKRLAERSAPAGDCIVYTGARDRDGYGVIGIGRGKQHRAHRVAYELAHGPIAAGMMVCHRCDVPACIKVEHLFLGTIADNNADRDSKGRRYVMRGEQHPMCKLPDAAVADIRARRSDGETLASIARSYGVSFQHVSAISRGVLRARG